jgi:dUTP pyrophosphatase
MGKTSEADLVVQILSPHARLPERHSTGAAGYDLSSVHDVLIAPGSWGLVGTGIAIAVPAGTYGRIAPRSGLSTRGVAVGAGVVDSDYRGEVKVLLVNHSATEELQVRRGDRVAQLILEAIVTPPVSVASELPGTSRGEAGFGSTGA